MRFYIVLLGLLWNLGLFGQASNWLAEAPGVAFVYKHDSLFEINFLEGQRYYLDNRIRIPLDSFEVMAEPDRSVKHTQAHVVTNKDTTIISFSGSGLVYGLNKAGIPIRLDETFFSGYNFHAFRGVHNNRLYSIGGTGFWQRHSLVTYYDPQLKEWEIIRPFPGLSDSYTHLFSAQLDSNTMVLFNDPEREEITDAYTFDVVGVDLKNMRARNIGILGASQKFRERPIRAIGSIGEFAFFVLDQSIYIGDVKANKLYRWAKEPVGASSLDGKEGLLLQGDTIYVFTAATTLTNFNRSLIKVTKEDLLNYCEDTELPLYQTVTTHVFEAYTAEFVFLSIAIIILAGFIIRSRYRRVPKEQRFVDSLSKHERAILCHLLKLPISAQIDIQDLDTYLEMGDKTWDNQRKIRSKALQNINSLANDIYGLGDMVVRNPSLEDRRIMLYNLSPDYGRYTRALLKNLESKKI